MKQVVFNFESDDIAEEFLNWWCNSGEQSFFICEGDIEANGEGGFNDTRKYYLVDSDVDFDAGIVNMTKIEEEVDIDDLF